MERERDWQALLDTEISRRDQRHAFLWAVFFSVAGVLVYLSRWLLWNTDEVSVWPMLLSVGLGGTIWYLLLENLVIRLEGAIQPQQYPYQKLNRRVLMVRLVAANGLPTAARSGAWPGIVAHILVASVLFVSTHEFAAGAWLTIFLGVLHVLFASLLLGFTHLMSHAAAASALAGLFLWTSASSPELESTGAEVEKSQKELIDAANARWPGRLLSKLHDTTSDRRTS